MTSYVGPCEMDCPENCTVPDGVTIAWVPAPRHNWADVARCPNDGCERAFLVLTTASADPSPVAGQVGGTA